MHTGTAITFICSKKGYMQNNLTVAFNKHKNSGGVCMKEIEEDVLRLIGAKHTKEILDFIEEHGNTQYKDMATFVSIHTLNARLQELRDFGLISHHFERRDVRREWYEITDTGKEFLKRLRDTIKLFE
jgi:DNA-binding HxlR family transcriptional regulator